MRSKLRHTYTHTQKYTSNPTNYTVKAEELIDEHTLYT